MQLLLEQAHAEVDLVDYGGFSPLHDAARKGAAGCVKLLLEHGADRHRVSVDGSEPAALATDQEIKTLLADAPGMKRKRSLSSSNSVMLEGTLPALAEKFFQVCTSTGDIKQLTALCVPELQKSIPSRFSAAVTAGVKLGRMHTCTRDCSVFVELILGSGAPGLLGLTFNDEGLVTSADMYNKVTS